MISNDQLTSFYRKLEELRNNDPFSSTGKESDRSMARRLGISHRCIKLYREGQIPDLATLRKIKANAGLTEDEFVEMVYAAVGVEHENPKRIVPVYDMNKTLYINSEFTGEPVMMLSPNMFDKPVSVIRVAYRAVEVDPSNLFCDTRLDFCRWVFVFNVNKTDPVTNQLYVFHRRDGHLYLGRLIIRGRQMWISEGDDEAATKITLDTFNNSIVGQVVDVKPLYESKSQG